LLIKSISGYENMLTSAKRWAYCGKMISDILHSGEKISLEKVWKLFTWL